jgi:ABC-type uncharacterized transport system substrate-binding protein
MFRYILTFIFAMNILYAHPHVFIEVHPSIIAKNGKTQKIHFKWIIDAMNSSMLIMQLDTNGNGKIDKNENSIAYSDYFSSLKEFNFYTILLLNNKPVNFKPSNFKATIENNRVCYSFDIPGSYNIKNLKFKFKDETFFVAMILKKKFIHIKGAKAVIKPMSMGGYEMEFKK